ncbi:MAG: DUF2442 domain-containing protein [Phascolarctobacterium sp.]|uniref:DUF2442 domain-containing protein n=1 Tax=Phascolarctobacterium sp. TaxID=2049039 RepID=UPI0026DBFD70|nr:DUF2442 domain-containing protein [Phascolarctobacterium sp.]MDO4920259.1 DUF2442 domain-containing protein [Phascolarctobacterium sp.]
MAKDVKYYLSKGFSQKAAEYFAGGRKKIKAVQANDNFTLTLTFDNGEKRLYNMYPLLQPDTIFEKLRNINVFKRVYLDDSACVSWDIDPAVDSSKVWNNKIDLCPDSCYIDSVPA